MGSARAKQAGAQSALAREAPHPAPAETRARRGAEPRSDRSRTRACFSPALARSANRWSASSRAPAPNRGCGATRSRHEPGQPCRILIDATALETTAELKLLWQTYQPWLGALAASGRSLIVARSPESARRADQAAARAALDGFNRSLAKEIGSKGATANLVYVDEGAEARLDAVVRFLLSRSVGVRERAGAARIGGGALDGRRSLSAAARAARSRS